MDLCSLLCVLEVHSHVVAANIATNDSWHPGTVGSPLAWACRDASNILKLSDGVTVYRNGSHPRGRVFPQLWHLKPGVKICTL